MAAGGFNARLESMRGVAALAVVYNHSVSFINAAGGLSSMPFSEHTTFMQSLLVLASVLSAGGAVILFFVLSGYVLSLSFLRKEQPISTQVGPYLVRRVFVSSRQCGCPFWRSLRPFGSSRTALSDGRSTHPTWYEPSRCNPTTRTRLYGRCMSKQSAQFCYRHSSPPHDVPEYSAS